MRVLVLDNGDPSTPFLVKALEELDAECEVRPSTETRMAAITALKPRRILITHGPVTPEESGVCRKVVQDLAGHIPILGLCLGMHVIAVVAGARLLPARPAKKPRARKTAKTPPPVLPIKVRHDGRGLFEALASPITVGRCDLPMMVEGGQEPPFIEFSAWSEEDSTVLGLRLSGLGVEGVQIDPQSFLTQTGSDLLFNFLYRSQTW